MDAIQIACYDTLKGVAGFGENRAQDFRAMPPAEGTTPAQQLFSELGTTRDFGEMEQSALKEAGNILASAYLNALSDFMGMMLVPSVPSLVIDLSGAVLTTAHLNFGHDRDYAFCVETSFRLEGTTEPLGGHFLLLPDMASLRSIFDAIRLP